MSAPNDAGDYVESRCHRFYYGLRVSVPQPDCPIGRVRSLDMKLGNRFAALGDRGGGWDLYLRAKQMLADGEPILNLTVGDHDIPTEQPILDAMHRSATAGRTGYTMLAGITPLRQRIAELATTRTGVQTNAGNVVIFNGGQAALFAAHLAALSPGDRGVFPDPYYPTYPPLIAAVGGQGRSASDTGRKKIRARLRSPGRNHERRPHSPNQFPQQSHRQRLFQGDARICCGHCDAQRSLADL